MAIFFSSTFPTEPTPTESPEVHEDDLDSPHALANPDGVAIVPWEAEDGGQQERARKKEESGAFQPWPGFTGPPLPDLREFPDYGDGG